jgi:hypothetical protein
MLLGSGSGSPSQSAGPFTSSTVKETAVPDPYAEFPNVPRNGSQCEPFGRKHGYDGVE